MRQRVSHANAVRNCHRYAGGHGHGDTQRDGHGYTRIYSNRHASSDGYRNPGSHRDRFTDRNPKPNRDSQRNRDLYSNSDRYRNHDTYRYANAYRCPDTAANALQCSAPQHFRSCARRYRR